MLMSDIETTTNGGRRRRWSVAEKLRISAVRVRARPDGWLFPDLPKLDDLIDAVLKRLVGPERRQWAKDRHSRELAARHLALEEQLKPGVALGAELERGNLRFVIDGIPAITGTFAPPEQVQFIFAQWRVLASRIEVSARMTGRKLAAKLRKASPSADGHIMADIIRLQEAISVQEETAELQARISEAIYRLHDLTPEEISMVEAAVG